MLGNDLTIYETVKLSLSVFLHAANTPFPRFDLAPVLAKITADVAFCKGCIEHCLFHADLSSKICSTFCHISLLVAMVVLPVPPFPLAMQITIRLTPVSWWPRTWGIFAQSREFRFGGEIVRHSLGKHSLHRGLRQSRHVGRGLRRLAPYLYLFQGLDLLGLFRLLVASYSPPYLVFFVSSVYANRLQEMRRKKGGGAEIALGAA